MIITVLMMIDNTNRMDSIVIAATPDKVRDSCCLTDEHVHNDTCGQWERERERERGAGILGYLNHYAYSRVPMIALRCWMTSITIDCCRKVMS